MFVVVFLGKGRQIRNVVVFIILFLNLVYESVKDITCGVNIFLSKQAEQKHCEKIVLNYSKLLFRVWENTKLHF